MGFKQIDDIDRIIIDLQKVKHSYYDHLHSKEEIEENYTQEINSSLPLKVRIANLEKLIIEETIKEFDYDMNLAASYLEVAPSSLYRKTAMYGIKTKAGIK